MWTASEFTSVKLGNVDVWSMSGCVPNQGYWFPATPAFNEAGSSIQLRVSTGSGLEGSMSGSSGNDDGVD